MGIQYIYIFWAEKPGDHLIVVELHSLCVPPLHAKICRRIFSVGVVRLSSPSPSVEAGMSNILLDAYTPASIMERKSTLRPTQREIVRNNR